MKKIILCALFAGIMFPFFASAVDLPPAVAPTAVEPIPDANVEKVIDVLTNWFFAIFLVVAVWFFIWAGFTFLTANGDPEKVSKARNQVAFGLVGVLVAVLAKGLVGFAMSLARP